VCVCGGGGGGVGGVAVQFYSCLLSKMTKIFVARNASQQSTGIKPKGHSPLNYDRATVAKSS